MYQACWGWWVPICVWSVIVAKHWRLLEYWFQEGREEKKWLLRTIGHKARSEVSCYILKITLIGE